MEPMMAAIYATLLIAFKGRNGPVCFTTVSERPVIGRVPYRLSGPEYLSH
jgi:hypothetical protein